MKTWEEFVEQGERSKLKHARPGEEGFFPYNAYLGITKNYKRGDKYEIFTHPEEIEGDLNFFKAGEYLCDYLTKYACLCWDINFSDNILEEERRFWLRLCYLVLDKGICQGRLNDAITEAANYRPAAIRAANAGLYDKWK